MLGIFSGRALNGVKIVLECVSVARGQEDARQEASPAAGSSPGARSCSPHLTPGVLGQRGAGQGAPTSTSQPLEPPAAPLVLLLAVPSCVLGLRERSAIILGTGSRRCPWRSAVRKRILPCFPLSSGSANSVFLFLAVLQRVMNVADLPSDKWHAISCLFRDHISSL